MQTRQQLVEELDAQIRAGATGFYIQSSEEDRLDDLLKEVCSRRSLEPLEWSRAYGWSNFATKLPRRAEGERAYDLATGLEAVLDDDFDGRLIILKHARLGLEGNDVAIARLSSLLGRLSRHSAGRSAIVLVSERLDVPSELEARLMVYGLALPRGEEIEKLISARHKVAPDLLQRLVVACGGLAQSEIFHALSLADVTSDGKLGESALDVVLKQKEQVIAKGGVLEMVPADLKVEQIGGLRNLKEWLARRAKVMLRLGEATSIGVLPPKGVLIAGMPGCGKSLTAKVTASLFGLPLLRLDIGSLLGKYVGESEHNMRRALQTAEAISPCVLWIDELEKAFVGMGGANASEVTSRLLGYFLTWMQEKSGAVFTIATANDITALPPELLRKGRFDEIFYVGFPDTAERLEILRIHLERRRQNVEAFDLASLAERCRGYTGADMENAINEAMVAAFCDESTLNTDHLVTAIAQTRPLRETLRDKVGEYEAAFEKLKLTPASHHDGLSIAQMIRQADDNNPLRRLEVAQCPDAPEEVLTKLANDDDEQVKKAVLKHPLCPESLLSALISAGREADPELFGLACLHKQAPLDLLERELAAGEIDKPLYLQLLRVTTRPERLLRALGFAAGGSTPFEHSGVGTHSSANDDAVMVAVANNAAASEELQIYLSANDAPVNARLAVARNGALSRSASLQLAQDPSRDVRAALAQNNIPETVQQWLARDESDVVRQALAGNRSLAPVVQEELAKDRSLRVRLDLIAGDNEYGMLLLVDDESDQVFDALIRCSSLPDEVVWKILDCENHHRRKKFVEHYVAQGSPPWFVLHHLTEDPHPSVREALCKLPPEILSVEQTNDLLSDTELNEQDRLFLARLTRDTTDVLSALLDNESSQIRAVGIHRLVIGKAYPEWFYDWLVSLDSWVNGGIPKEVLSHPQSPHVKVQMLLATHHDAEVRKGIALRPIDESIRQRLQEDGNDSVRTAARLPAHEARSSFGWWRQTSWFPFPMDGHPSSGA